MMEVEKMIEQLIERLAAPTLPVSNDLWDTKYIGAYLKRSVTTVRDRIVVRPDFPKAVRLERRGDALYKAREVIAWAESHQEKLPTPRRARTAL
jgi:hypothetical protein